jgi:ribosome-binding factor A
MANPRSLARITARIHERVAHCLTFELKDPRAGFITVTRVELAPDVSSAKIYYSVLGSEGDRSKVQHMLQQASGFVRKKVARVLETRRVPQLVWRYDDSIENAAQVNRAIHEALERDRAINPHAHQDVVVEEPAEDQKLLVEHEYNEFLDEQEEGSGP